MKAFHNRYGLLNAHLDEDVAENTVLWTVEYIILLYLLSEEALELKYINKGNEYVIKGVAYVDACETFVPGLYNQFPPEIEIKIEKDRWMSPDQLIGFAAMYELGVKKEPIKRMWEWLWRHFFTYDNVNKRTNFSRIMQPSAILFLGLLAENPILTFMNKYKPLRAILKFILGRIPCTLRPDQTSGKLKAFVIYSILGWDVQELLKYFDHRYFVNWTDVFKVYFPNPEHPIRKVLEEVTI